MSKPTINDVPEAKRDEAQAFIDAFLARLTDGSWTSVDAAVQYAREDFWHAKVQDDFVFFDALDKVVKERGETA